MSFQITISVLEHTVYQNDYSLKIWRNKMKFESKEEFAKAIIDAGEDGLVSGKQAVIFNSEFRLHIEGQPSTSMVGEWKIHKEDWQPYVKPIPNKSLVWCWDNRYKVYRGLGVYDAPSNGIFNPNVKNSTSKYDNYKQLTPEEIQPWMQELIDNCEE